MTSAKDTLAADLRLHTGRALLQARGNSEAQAKVLAELAEATAFALAFISRGNAAAASELFERTTAYLLERTTSNTTTLQRLLNAQEPRT
jgi:hypothetical protein